ncbi:MAG: hypothetical protein U0X73_04905 [Thermoanaerobaculia bacterium]
MRLAAAIAIGVALAAVGVERSGWLHPASVGTPSDALWIWGPSDPRAVEPRVFFLARDLQLVAVPERAELRILADEEYVVHLNGERIGSDRWRPGAPLDRYDVTARLRAGANRIAIELRSATGTGGLLCAIVDPATGRSLVASDARWSVYPGYWGGLLGGHQLIPAAAPLVWGRPPIGRWGTPQLGPEISTFRDATRDQAVVAAWRWRDLADRGEWRRFRPGRQRLRLGAWAEIDFGGPVCGYLQIDHAAVEPRAALLRYGDEPEASAGWRPDAIAITAPGRGWWQDSLPRCFRYVTIAGLDSLLGATLMSVEPSTRGRLPASAGEPPGLLGLRPPLSRSPVENKIWSELEGGAGVAVR